MSKRTARHRATPAKGATLEALSQAITSNAGSLGRSTAVVAAASGLVLSMAPAANAAPAKTERVSTKLPATLDLEQATQTDSADADVVTVEAKPVDGRGEVQVTAEVADPAPEVETAEESASTSDNASQSSAQSSSSTDTASAQAAADAPAPEVSGAMGKVVSAAYSGIGRPYVFGGKTPAGWDCSGFTAWSYAQAGLNIPSSTSAIRASGLFTRVSNPQPGDLVFQNGGSHVGIYVGNGQMIGAQNPSVGTILHPVTRNPLMGYYRYNG